jgi:hypothetical protein
MGINQINYLLLVIITINYGFLKCFNDKLIFEI